MAGFDIQGLIDALNNQKSIVESKLSKIKEGGETDSIGIADMFEMQVMMNKLSQLSEMSTSTMSASNAAIQSLARNVKT